MATNDPMRSASDRSPRMRGAEGIDRPAFRTVRSDQGSNAGDLVEWVFWEPLAEDRSEFRSRSPNHAEDPAHRIEVRHGLQVPDDDRLLAHTKPIRRPELPAAIFVLFG